MDYYLTSERLAELKQELNELKTAKRAEVAERLKRAKELGDLSENSEYFEAREEQGQVEARIAEVEEMVKNASIISKTHQKGSVQIGSSVVVSKNGKNMTFAIVGSNETKPEEGKISNESPIGKALYGKKVGDEARVKAPSGEVSYKIVSIE